MNTQISAAICSAFSAISCAERSVFSLSARGSHRVVSAGTDSRNAVVRLDDLARSGYDHQRFAAGDNQHRFQLTHGLVAAPFLRQLDGGALQIAGKLFQLGFKAVAERERVETVPAKPVTTLPPKMRRTLCAVAFEDGAFAHRHLAVARDGNFAVLPTAQMVVPLSVIYVYLRYDTLGYVRDAVPQPPSAFWNVIHCIPTAGVHSVPAYLLPFRSKSF